MSPVSALPPLPARTPNQNQHIGHRKARERIMADEGSMGRETFEPRPEGCEGWWESEKPTPAFWFQHLEGWRRCLPRCGCEQVGLETTRHLSIDPRRVLGWRLPARA